MTSLTRRCLIKKNARLVFYIHFRLWQRRSYWNLSKFHGVAVKYKLPYFFLDHGVYIYTYSYPLCGEWVIHQASEERAGHRIRDHRNEPS